MKLNKKKVKNEANVQKNEKNIFMNEVKIAANDFFFFLLTH